MALLIFTITIFVSAFLLFLVQPLVGKMILPKLGGTPQVWNTCMVFFQSVLLLGYAYTHFVSTRFKLRQQLMIHSILMALPILLMLIFPMYATVQAWNPPTGGNPIPDTLMLLAMVVGIPFFVVSTSAPLLQKWFGYSGHETAHDPYFLYSASNAGSLLSLFFYPALIEPLTYLHDQSWIWFGGYVILAGLILYCAYTIFTTAPPDEQILATEAAAAAPPAPAPETPVPMPSEPAPVPAKEAATAVKSGPAPGGRGIQRKKGMKPIPGRHDEERAAPAVEIAPIATGATAEMTTWRRIRWVLLAAVPSSLMLGVTSYISTDLSPFPLVWIIPLALYLLSFILVYTKIRRPGFSLDWTGKRVMLFGPPGYSLHQMILYVGHPLGIIILMFIVLKGGFDPFFATTLVMIGFFTTALACHGELALDRPDTRHLTEYFLLMSVGGMVGGIFNGIIAPLVFTTGVLEFYIAIVIACVVRPQYVLSGWFDNLVLQAFPQFHNWVRNQGDEMAKSMGRPAPHTSYLFSYFLDITFGAFILGISYWLVGTFGKQATLVSIMKFFSLPLTDQWVSYLYNAFTLGIPMVFCFFFAGRPLRLALAVLGLMLGNMYLTSRGDDRSLVEARRTYFGLLKVMQNTDYVIDEEEAQYFRAEPIIEDGKMTPYAPPYPFTFLMHGTTYHGRNYLKNVADKYEKNRVDLSRLATTYYHRYGPVGVVMEPYNWAPSRQNTFFADARVPVSLIGQTFGLALTGGNLTSLIPQCASEPACATIGLGTGTMASYGRPYQHVTYYEIDEVIRGFSLPQDGRPARFTYLQNAIKRGVNLEVIMGDARQSLQRDGTDDAGERYDKKNSLVYSGDYSKEEPVIADEIRHFDKGHREKYYKVIVVDAFSSDAIPIHLCTKEALKIYMDRLTEDGVLCMHTSNRHMDLVRPVARIAMELKASCIVGKDSGVKVAVGGREESRYMGHFGSEYVMLFRGKGFSNYVNGLKDKKADLIKSKVMKQLPENPRQRAHFGRAPDGLQILNSVVEWYDPYKDHTEVRHGELVRNPITINDSLWTDDYSYILGVLR